MIIGRLLHHSEAVKYPLYSDENTTEEEEWVDESIAQKSIWAADFETTTKANLEKDGCVRVYLWSLVSSDLTEEYWGTDIESFIETIKEKECGIIFFHNLAFDGSFILSYFNDIGYRYEIDYDCIIDDLNNWYQIRIYTENKEIKVLKSGHEKFIDLFEEINKAKHHIHLEYFNFRNDSIANALFDLLAKKAEERLNEIREKYAREIYSALRKADKLSPKLILIEGVKREGIGIAIMNRLLRAASYDVLGDKED